MAFFVAAILGLVEILFIPIQFVFVLAFGWVMFLWRTVPALEVGGKAVAWVLVLTLLVMAGTHWLGRTMAGAKWNLRRTFLIHGFIAVLLLTAVGMTGTAHQAAWLAKSNRAWFTGRSNARITTIIARQDRSMMDLVLQRAQGDSMPKGAWHDFLQADDLRLRNSIVRFPEDQTIPGIVVLIPRDPETLARVGFTFWPTNGPFLILPVDRLESTLLSLQKAESDGSGSK